MVPEPDRHLDLERIERYLAQHVPGTVLVEGDPDALLVIEPAISQLSVMVPLVGPAPDLTRYRQLDAHKVDHDGRRWHRLTARGSHALGDLYPVLRAVLDRVQLDHLPFADAVDQVLDVYRDLLTTRSSLIDTQQIGLTGELLTLRVLMHRLGSADALQSWLGPLGEEHDFALREADVDVKTTTTEMRAHWISSTTQLMPRPDRPLYLLSIQLTRAGSDNGLSLPELVSDVRSAAGADHSALLETRLREVGYRDQDADLYTDVRAYRNPPLCFRIDDGFPALTQPRLEQAVPQAQRVMEYRYRVDLTGLPPSPPPISLEDFVTTGGHPQP